MTAEIAIMNTGAVALASDSAVTAATEDNQKVFVSATKIFALSKYHPVGIMVYGNATFMGIPWETIVKTYRSQLGTRKFETLKEYARAFTGYLDGGNPLFPTAVQDEYVRNSIFAYYQIIRDEITTLVHLLIDQRGGISSDAVADITAQTIRRHYRKWKNASTIPSVSGRHSAAVLSRYKTLVDEALQEVFEQLPIAARQGLQLRKLAGFLFSKFLDDIHKMDLSGVVVAGFGEAEVFPSLESYEVEGIAADRLKYRGHISRAVSFDMNAAIIPFAQQEMVITFMEGMHPGLQERMDDYLAEVFHEYPSIIAHSIGKLDAAEKRELEGRLVEMSSKLFQDYRQRVRRCQTENHVDPVTAVVAVLPKDELAAMAESLVSLTAFKRKVTMETETVAGPTDVAVISKGDGLIWIKRKHYFKPELNPQFLANYYREG